MAEYMPAPSFNLGYNVSPMNIGEGYAAGITQAGKSLSEATKGVFDVASRNQNVNDTLTAMHQSGALSDEDYQAVMGKSLGARESMLGMYASQWIAQQQQQRQIALEAAKGQIDVTTTGQKTAQQIQQYQQLGLLPPGADPKKVLIQPNQATVQPSTATLAGPTGPLAPPPVTPAQATAIQHTAQGPLGSADITHPVLTAPGVKMGSPITPDQRSNALTPGSMLVPGRTKDGRSVQFIKYPDGTLSQIL